MLAQQAAESTPGLVHLLLEVYWLGTSVNQIAFRQLAHFHFKPVNNVMKHLTRVFSTAGNTKLIDKTIDVAGQVLEPLLELAERTSATADACGTSGWNSAFAAYAPEGEPLAALSTLVNVDANKKELPTKDASSCRP